MLNSTIRYSRALSADRLDAEYFQPEFLKLQKKLKRKKFKPLHELCEFIRTGPAGSRLLASAYCASGIKVYRPSNLKGWTCDNADLVYISKEYREKQRLQLYHRGDILVTRIGDLKLAIIQDAFPVAISPNLCAIRTKKHLLDPYFLLAFLNTRFGYDQIRRGRKQVSLASIEIGQIGSILVPGILLDVQIKIGKFVRIGLYQQKLAGEIYALAERLLLQEFNFQKTDKRQLSAVVNLINLQEAKRADSEYFLNTYSKKLVSKTKIKTVALGEIAHVIRGIEPGSKAYQKKGNSFLRVSNISKYGLLRKSQKYIDNILYKKLAVKYQPQPGEILLVKDGKPGTACIFNKPIKGIISEGIVRVKLFKCLTAEYVSLCINSSFCRQQILADIDGCLVPHWKIARIKKLWIPIISAKIQTECVLLMKKYHLLFQKSERNLLRATNLINVLMRPNFRSPNS